MEGQTAVREIRHLEEAQRDALSNVAKIVLTSGAKIIMITVLDDVRNVVEAFKSLRDAYLFKPIDTARLLDHLREIHLI